MAPVPLSRIAWLLTVAACVIAAVLLLVASYQGYAGLAVAVGASAAINLR
jgi:negative regulator of sigma E activity